MTAPRPVHAGTTYLITRRCLNRMLLLRPSKAVTEVFAFILARAAKRTGVQVHAFCVMSNHYHLVVTDPQARLPEFTQYLDAFVARATNALLGRWEQFWGGHSYSAVVLGSSADVVSKVAYTLANPVAAGLVRAGQLWPGLWSDPASFGSTTGVQRPDHFFDKKGKQPEWEELELVVPAGFSSADGFRAQVEGERKRLEQAARNERQAFLGADRVLEQGPFTMPKSREQRRGINPQVAARDRWRRIEVLGRLKTFLSEYAAALLTWREGKEAPVFPAGTYLMRVAHGVSCARPM